MFFPTNKRNNEEFNRLINNFFTDGFFEPLRSFENGFKTDMVDKGDHYLIESELAGFKKEDIEVDYKNEHVVIKAVRNFELETKDKNDNFIYKERKGGHFSRTFYVGDIEKEKIKAKFENGILTLNVPKKSREDKKDYRIDIE